MKKTLIGMVLVAAFVLLLFTMRGCGSAPDAAIVRTQMSPDQLALGEPIVNSVDMVLVPIPAGEFLMGSAKTDVPGQDQAVERQHRVTITQACYMSVCEVTQQQYERVMGARPWEGQPLVRDGADYAASYIRWDDATEFCRKLSEQERVEYRLPTEAEWEYACRAGAGSAYSFGDDASLLEDCAWYNANAYAAGAQYAHPVGRKRPNAWGLYDMHGNVWEWCQDWYGPYGGQAEVTDPRGPEKGRFRVWRGGGFADPPINLRSATRLSFGRVDYRPEFMSGFRVVRSFTQSP